MQLRGIRILEGTKISHDEWNAGETFEYAELVKRAAGIPAIGIPAAANNLLIIDVDAGGSAHKFDGRPAWSKYAQDTNLPQTYTVITSNGGYHFYFRLPPTVNKAVFKPKKELFHGVDIKYNGYVRCPPTEGFRDLWGTHDDIAEAPITLIRDVLSRPTDTQDITGPVTDLNLHHIHTPISAKQLVRLKKMIEWTQVHASLSYHQWFEGLVSLKTGIRDEEVLKEFAILWSHNQSWKEGDDEEALAILERTKEYGGIGPGTIFGILKELMGDHKQTPENLMTQADIIEKAKVPVGFNNKSGLPCVTPIESNIAAIINVIPRFSKENLYLDVRKDSYMFNGEQEDDQTITDYITPILQSQSHGLGFQNFRRNQIRDSLQVLMTSRRVDPHAEWLRSLKWDGVKRIEKFFSRYLLTPDTEYTRAIGRNLWTALAARGLDPGCKMDNIIIIEGREGIKKSTLVQAIGGEYYTSLVSDESINNVESLRKMHQAAVVEIPELISLLNSSGESIKATLSNSVDPIRSPYARKVVDKARGFIIIGTSNSGTYLKESMGIRRYWPIRVPDEAEGIDIVGVKADRAQLFAEGVHRYQTGAEYWEMPKEMWSAEIELRKVRDPLAPVIEDLLMAGALTSDATGVWSIAHIYQALHTRELINRGLNKQLSDRFCSILRSIGAVERDYVDISGKKHVGWGMPIATAEELV